jgi:exonuclease SbcC
MRSAQDRFEDAKQLAEGIVHIEPEPLRAKVAVLQQAYERLREQAAQSRSEKDRLESLNTTATKLRGALVDAEASLRPAQELERIITGKAGQTIISLHAWVLGAYLDEVLSVASHRLVDLTRGRYELRRADDSADGVDRRTRAGLNIEVFDTHLGTSRPARTLSGGETFLASLSMALALAEVASSRGGQALDTVFIDEGFGTLDSETLDLAMDVLTRLRESGRTVGLISHVDELRRRIPAGIEVLKDEARGTATVKQ